MCCRGIINDIIIIADSRCNIRQLNKDLKLSLPSGLKFNAYKNKSFEVSKIPNKDTKEEIISFDFLGGFLGDLLPVPLQQPLRVLF